MASILRNISGRILLTVYLALLILSGYFITTSYITNIKHAETVELQRLYSISQTLSAQMDGDELQMILDEFKTKDAISDPTQNMYYQRQRDILLRAKELNQLPTAVYTISRDEITNGFFLGISTSTPLFFRHPYDTHPEDLEKKYETGGMIPHFTDAHGTWLSAISPVKNSTGKVVGVVEVDLPFDTFFVEAKGKMWRNVIFTLLIFLGMGIGLYFQIRNLLREDEKAKRQLESNNRIIEKINTELQQKNQDITSSIDYASRIQRSIIPSAEQLVSHFKNSFVFYKPKDIVSGDFYWFHEIAPDKCFLAVVDCTGHGVPGAFMSLIGHTLLNEIVIERGICCPWEILTELNKMIISLLQKEGNNINDGMDMALCYIDSEENTLTFAGAFNPLIHFRDGKMEVLKSDRLPIGGVQHDKSRRFREQKITIQPGDRLYMFTDGFADQFGGNRGKKYMIKRFYETLRDMQARPLKEHQDILEKSFNDWKGPRDQIDDVTIVGVEL